MNRKQLITKYIEFFKSKKHKEIPNASLIPANDPTVLFTTAGMHPLVPFLLGEKHPLGKRLVNVQRCIRTGDIEDVGDDFHLTFFEMLGNWSLGDYFKEEAIKMTFEFHTKVLGIPLKRYAVTCFSGNKNAKRDEESESIWLSLGIPKERIAFLESDNWWGPAGNTGPCGPCTEQFYYTGEKPPKKFNPEDKKWVEIGNDVLMQFVKNEKGNYEEAKQKNIDFGGGVERTLAVLNGFDDNYLTEIWQPLIKEIEKLSKKKYEENKKEFRIIADHIKASVFILAEKIAPSNVERGYVLRRLIRRAVRYARVLGIQNDFTKALAETATKLYPDYTILKENERFILEEIEKEENRFRQCIASGLRYFENIAKGKRISGKDAFLLYQSYGFPLELTQEMANEKNMEVDILGYEKEESEHRKLSQTASAGRFKSGLADNSEATTKLHTIAHLMLAALRQVLKKPIEQKGSNITAERLRFDFNFDRKLDEKEVREVEEVVNRAISEKLEVKREELSLEQAKKQGATGVFEDKYREKVSVYTICDSKKTISKEICAGPHVSNLSELGKFRIKEQESVGAGVRRIKAVLI
ncbi:MAG: alanine--tRNA ligase [Nanoarchaeota archaeon]|nr:alanine--tRNA ligase [Nanoarchaeota archaeon]